MTAHTVTEAINIAALANQKFTELVDKFNLLLQASLSPDEPMRIIYSGDLADASIPLVEAAKLLSDAVVDAIDILEDRVLALEGDTDKLYEKFSDLAGRVNG